MSNKSAEAFLHQIESGKRATYAGMLYTCIMHWHISRGYCSLEGLGNYLQLKHQTASARLSELCDMGVIFEDHNGYFHITPPDKIAQYAAMREDARYKKWRKLGDKNGWFNQLKLV